MAGRRGSAAAPAPDPAESSEAQAQILEEEVDNDYEPTEEQVVEYAEWLGIDVDEHKDLLWIAKEGLKAALPPAWKPCQTTPGDDGEIFYFNFETGESVWDHPCDEYHRQLYKKERAKKLGIPVEDMSEDDRSGKSGSESRDLGASGSKSADVDKKAKKDKKDKKAKKEKKEKDKDKDKDKTKKLSALEPLKDLPPLGAQGFQKLGSKAQMRDMDLEESLEESLDSKMLGELEESLDSRLDPGDGSLKSDDGKMGQSLEEVLAETERRKREENLGTVDEEESDAADRRGLGTKEKEEEKEKEKGSARSSSSRAQVADTEVEEELVDYRKKREEEGRSNIDSELDGKLDEIRKSAEEAHQKKVGAIDSENKAKLVKSRKELQEQFDDEKDKIFAELQDKHDKQLREEKQRLQQELGVKKKGLGDEVAAEARASQAADDQVQELREELEHAEDECDRLRKALHEEQDRLQAEVKLREEAQHLAEKSADFEEKLQAKSTDHEREVKDLQEESSAASQKLVETQQLLEEAQAKAVDAGSGSAEAAEARDALSKAEEASEKEMAKVSKEVLVLQTKLEDIETEREQLKNDCEEVEALRGAARNHAEELLSLKESSGTSEEEFAAAKDSHEKMLSVLRTEHAEELLSAKESSGTSEEEVAAVKDSHENMLSVLRSEHAAEQTEVLSLETQLADLAEEHTLAKADLESQQVDGNRLTKEIDTHKAEIERLRAQHLDNVGESEEASQKLRLELEAEISRLSSEHSEREEHSKHLSEKEEKSRECRQELEQTLAARNEAFATGEKELQRLRDELEASLQNASVQAAGASEESEKELQQQAAAWEAERLAFEEQLQALRAELPEANAATEEVLQALRSQLENECSAATKAREEVEVAAGEIQALKSTGDASESELDRLRGEASYAKEELSVIVSELADLRSSFSAKCAECDQLRGEAMHESEARFDDLRTVQDELDQAKEKLIAEARKAKGLETQLADERTAAEKKLVEEIEAAASPGLAALSAASAEATIVQEASARELAAAQEELRIVSEECQSLRDKVCEGSDAHADDLRRVQSELAAANTEISYAEAKEAATLHELTALRSDLAASVTEREQLKANVHSGSSGVSLDELARLQAMLEREREHTAQARAEAAVSSQELLRLTAALEKSMAECTHTMAKPEEIARLQTLLDKERESASKARTDVSAESRELARFRDEMDTNASGSNQHTVALEENKRLQSILHRERENASLSRAEALASKQELARLGEEMEHIMADRERPVGPSEEVLRSQAMFEQQKEEAMHAKAEVAALTREMDMLRLSTGGGAGSRELSRHGENREYFTADRKRPVGSSEEVMRSQAMFEQQKEEAMHAKAEVAALTREMDMLRLSMGVGAGSRELSRHGEDRGYFMADRKRPVGSSEEVMRSQAMLEQQKEEAMRAKAEVAVLTREMDRLRSNMESKPGVGAMFGSATDEVLRLQSKLERERESTAHAKSEVLSKNREISNLRSDLDARTDECRRLQADLQDQLRQARAQLDDEQQATAQTRTQATAAAVKSATDTAALIAELEGRALECGQLRAELIRLQTIANHLNGEHENRRPQSARGSTKISEACNLKVIIRERDDDLLQLKAEFAQATSAHEREIFDLRNRLAQARGRCSDSGSEDMPVERMRREARESSDEIERLRRELRGSTDELDRSHRELRSAESRAQVAETALAAETVKIAVMERVRAEGQMTHRGIDEAEDGVGGRGSSERTQREIRRLEKEEKRSAQRIEALQMELDRSREELRQLREDSVGNERLLEDARTAVRSEHNARALSDAAVREAQREVRTLRDQTQQHPAEAEILNAEIRRARNDVVERDGEITQLRQQVRSRDAELVQLRSQREVQSQHGDAAAKHQWSELRERESAVDEKERTLEERERLAGEGEAMLHDRRRELRVEMQRAELASLKAAVTELTVPRSARLGGMDNGEVEVLTGPPDGLTEGLVCVVGQSADAGRVSSRAGLNARPADEQLCALSPVASSDEDMGPSAQLGQAASALDSRRRELRQERAALEELRRQWKSEGLRIQASGGSAQAQMMLQEVRIALDDRALAMNKGIEELKVLERVVGGSKQRRERTSSSCARVPLQIGKSLRSDPSPCDERTPRANEDPSETLRRWQNLLDGSSAATPRGTSTSTPRAYSLGSPRLSPGERQLANWTRKRIDSRDKADKHLHWLRNFHREVVAVGGSQVVADRGGYPGGRTGH